MNKEMLGDESRWTPPVRKCFLLYTACTILLIAAVICLILPDFAAVCRTWVKQASPSCIQSLLSGSGKAIDYLKRIIDKNGIKAMISAIGIYTVAFAWLVSIQQQKVYGVAIGTLLRWAYPGFYRFYFLVFIGMELVGLYACSIPGHRCATGLAAIGIAFGVIYSVWVCYRFVLDFYARRRIAEAYHYAQITMGKEKRKRPKLIPMCLYIVFSGIIFNRHPDECRAGQFQDEQWKRKIEESTGLLGRTLAEQEKNGEWIHISAVLDLWYTAYSRYKNLTKADESKPESVNELCYLAERLWGYALSKDLLPDAQARLAGTVIKECQRQNKYEYRDAIDCLMVGLLLYLSNGESGLEYGDFKTLLPKLAWEETHWIHLNKIIPDFYLYEGLIIGYLWMTLMTWGKISSPFWDFLKKSDFIRIGDQGIRIKIPSARMETFLVTVDNAFAERKGSPKQNWMRKAEKENLLEKIVKFINTYYNSFC